eukprot:CAMPEP_0182447926 /NCGR_PEP_ID=MMETSP1172-20130603/21736_1 /TAXON_ID=708627 /ORGANISM="Timspurckia oligopyrenoides, Strain CCMP3278" /LENGTH=349 /DNA_ID=CAMNT_0024644575 /DNA_START=389 /DNA_END=1438 /DNA_ORIENTATION=+
MKNIVCFDKNQIALVFERMHFSLLDVIQSANAKREYLAESNIRTWIYQILGALAFMHEHGIVHRDIKPENILLNETKTICKLGDFGLARDIPTKARPGTEYISTRWYRAPEVLLRAGQYSETIDVFAVGAVMAELFTGRPLFPGSDELDQIQAICSVLGTIRTSTWKEGAALMHRFNPKVIDVAPVSLKNVIPQASPAALELISDMLRYNPNDRPTAREALNYDFFASSRAVRVSIDGFLQSSKSVEAIRGQNCSTCITPQILSSMRDERKIVDSENMLRKMTNSETKDVSYCHRFTSETNRSPKLERLRKRKLSVSDLSPADAVKFHVRSILANEGLLQPAGNFDLSL